MILDEITLYNFGLYADKQTLELTPPSPAKPVVLVGGLNGGGKTTLLDALQLCLYGAHARISNRGSMAYPEYLARCIYRGASSPEAAIEIAFRHTVEGHEDRYRLHRSWRMTDSGCKERFEVSRNGCSEPVLAENWITQVEDLMPPNIAHLFLFDGEQIESYASLSNSSGLIGAAIQNLLGLDVVDQLDKDLQVYERRHRSEEQGDAMAATIEAADHELNELYARTDQLAQVRASLLSHEIGRKEKLLARLEAEFRKIGGELYEKRSEIEQELQRADAEAEKQAETLRELSAGSLPLILMRDLLEAVSRRDRQEDEARRAREVAKTLQERDDMLLKRLRKEAVDGVALEKVKALLEEDRRTRVASSGQVALLDLSPEVRTDLHGLLRTELKSVSKASPEKLRQYQSASAHAERLRAKFDSIPGADAIAELAAERDGLRSEINSLKSRHESMGQEIERLHREIERKTQSFANVLEQGADAVVQLRDRERILQYSSRVRDTVSAFRRAITERHVRRIEQLVLESYKQLLRKESLVTRLTIDADTYALNLYGRDEKKLTPERLSAGERQLLAIALLWGLARASGRPLPTAIDTPLGRLDTQHRMHLVERYFPFASHQVLLLSTDEEITGEYLRHLEPWIGRKYLLSYNDKIGTTQVRVGYFESRAAA